MIVTGIGSRTISDSEERVIRQISRVLAKAGCTLRSGGADGADTAFEAGWRDVGSSAMEIFVPWSGFNGTTSDAPYIVLDKKSDLFEEAHNEAQTVHPAWYRLSRGAQYLHTRNIFQVRGPELKVPSDVIIAMADPVGRFGVKGGTSTAWTLGKRLQVPTFNLRKREDALELVKFVNERLQGVYLQPDDVYDAPHTLMEF